MHGEGSSHSVLEDFDGDSVVSTDDKSIVVIESRCKGPKEPFVFLKKERQNQIEQDLAEEKQHLDDSADYDPSTPKGRDMSINAVFESSSPKKYSKKKPSKKSIKGRKNSVDKEPRDGPDESASISSNEHSDFSNQSMSDNSNIVRRHLLMDSASPPETAHGFGIKCLCHYYSKTKDKPFQPINLAAELRRIYFSGDNIDWNGAKGVSKFCNDMEPKHFGTYKSFISF